MNQSGKLKNKMLKQVQHDVLNNMTVIPNLIQHDVLNNMTVIPNLFQHDVLQNMTVIPNLIRDLFEKEL